MARHLELDQKSRSELVEQARALGVERPERMTRVELVDEIVRRTTAPDEQEEARGLFGVARSMLASIVQSGLNLPDAASVIRGNSNTQVPTDNQAPVATVTLAEIYAAQGHKTRALRMLDEVLRQEPDHQEAERVKNALLGKNVEDKPTSSSSSSSTELAAASEASVTPDYVPGGFVETTGEEIRTGKPPQVAEAASTEAAVAAQPSTEPTSAAQAVERPQAQKPQAEVAPPETQAEKATPITQAEPAQASSKQAALPYLVLKHSQNNVELYWELPEQALEHCGVDRGEGFAALRIVAFIPAGSSPERIERTVSLWKTGEAVREQGLESLVFEEGAIIRAALGWESGDMFLPLCVGKSLKQLKDEDKTPELLKRAQQALR